MNQIPTLPLALAKLYRRRRLDAAKPEGADVPGFRAPLRLNPDGVSVKGCSHIYAPKGQAGEYAPLAVNPYRGCGFGCAYCYVPLVTRQARPDFNAGAVPREHLLKHLLKDAKKYEALGIGGQAMLSFTSDPFNPADQSLTRPSIEILKDHGLGFCTLTKGGTAALPYLDLYRGRRDAFASTLTSLDDDFSRKWEPQAALPADRIEALKTFHAEGIYTWVSLEPTLSIEASLAIVARTHEFVDLFKVGRANYLGELTKNTDWRDYTLRMIEVLNRLGVKHYIKKDLQRYLPAGYSNKLRVRQHR